MEWALQKGRWDAYRFCAVDANENNRLFPIPNLLKNGMTYQVYIGEEYNQIALLLFRVGM